MPFTQAELDNITAMTLDHHLKGKVHSQHVQAKPLLNALLANKKEFTGGKDFITDRVKGTRNVTIQGYTHNDTVTYSNPAEAKQVQYAWKELHAGITVTLTELKKGGISVVDTTVGKRVTRPEEGEKVRLADLLDDKMDTMSEDVSDGLHRMMWQDGTQDAKEIPGIQSIILDDPSAVGASVGGLSSENLAWWRNRAVLGMNTGTTDIIASTMQSEFRQLRRYAQSRPKWQIFAGSDFLDALEAELRAKGQYTDTGWADKGGLDISMDDVRFKRATFRYDPKLDDLSRAKYCYVIDMSRIKLRPMRNEWDKQHNPARPETVYAIYKAVTHTGAITANQLNTSGVYSIL